MHYYNMQSDQIHQMYARIRELEEIAASSELTLGMAWEEVHEGRRRERRLLWTAIALGALAAVAIMRVAIGR